MSELKALRADIRHWRQGRATAKLVDVLSDAYVAVFATLLLGSMLVNVVVNVRRVSGDACSGGGCQEARTLLPWLFALAAVLVVLAAARTIGPVFVSPAVGSWLLTAPVDRRPVLRPRLVVMAAIGLVVAALVTLGAVTLGGFGTGPLLAVTGGAGLLGVLVVALAASSQSGGHLSRVVVLVLALAIWVGLLALAFQVAPSSPPPSTLAPVGLGILVVVALVAVGLLAQQVRSVDRLTRYEVAPGGDLVPALSGALAGLDLALLYDVLIDHRWGRHGAVRSRRFGRGGPSGPSALVWSDLTRLRRSPGRLLLLAAAVAVPYAAETAGGGRVLLLIASATGFLAGLPMLSALRVITRTPSLVRAMPFPVATTRMTTLYVPGGALVLFGLGTVGAVHGAVGVTWSDAVVLGLTIGLSATAAATRWVTGRPPDYTKPLLTTPAGGVPTNLYGSAVRGFDVLLLTTAPLLLSPTVKGAVFSMIFSFVVVSVLVGRE